MAKPGRRQLVLSIIATDSTYQQVSWRGRAAWQGRCIHCRRQLLVDLEGEPIGDVTVEHIVPRRHGGGDDLENLALACGRCNHQKGYRLDDRRADDPVLRKVIDTLTARRRERWRAP